MYIWQNYLPPELGVLTDTACREQLLVYLLVYPCAFSKANSGKGYLEQGRTLSGTLSGI